MRPKHPFEPVAHKLSSKLSLLAMAPPVCWPYLNPLVGFGCDPSADNATLNRMRAVFFDDGYFKITDVRRRRYGLPIHIKIVRRQPTRALI